MNAFYFVFFLPTLHGEDYGGDYLVDCGMRKCFLLWLIITMPHFCDSQNLVNNTLSKDERYIRKLSLEIMNILKIKISKRAKQDNLIKYRINNSLGILNAEFTSEKISFKKKYNGDIDTSTIVYINPQIILSPQLYSIIFRDSNVSRIHFIKAIGSILHEITHYHQYTFFYGDSLYYAAVKAGYGSPIFRKYYEQKKEVEAYAVQAYFMMWHLNRTMLNKIMSLRIKMEEKLMILVNENYRLSNQDNRSIFPEKNLENIKF